MQSMLEERSLEVLMFAGFTAFSGRDEENATKNMEDEEVFHRLMEVTTRLADYSICRRLADSLMGLHPDCLDELRSMAACPTETKLLLLSRLIARAPSLKDILHVIDTSLLTPIDGGVFDVATIRRETLGTVLRSAEVVVALATRLTPASFKEEIVEKRLLKSDIILGEHTRELIMDTLHSGGFHDVSDRFCVRQVHLELAASCSVDELEQTAQVLGTLVQRYLCCRPSLSEKGRFLAQLIYTLDDIQHSYVANFLLDKVREGLSPDACHADCIVIEPLLLEVFRIMIVRDHRPGDAALLLRHLLDVLDKQVLTLPVGKSEDESIVFLHSRPETFVGILLSSFSTAVAHLGLVDTDYAVIKDPYELLQQWLKLLAEIPSSMFSESTLVVWVFWSMRALLQLEEAMFVDQSYQKVEEQVKEGVLRAVSNLSKALELCEVDAVLPPMLLNWLVSTAGMTWVDAVSWLSESAGENISESRKFTFIRLPVGSVALNTLAKSSRQGLLLMVEAELQKRAYLKQGRRWHVGKISSHKLDRHVNQVFESVRHALLKSWYYDALNVGISAVKQPVALDCDSMCSDMCSDEQAQRGDNEQPISGSLTLPVQKALERAQDCHLVSPGGSLSLPADFIHSH
ncbi:hypothetical protein TRVL_06792 [Trypanosoma vivax]|nr:hypothetical protein TRVL_06792 [Trypanosoma vivax]